MTGFERSREVFESVVAGWRGRTAVMTHDQVEDCWPSAAGS